MLALTSIRGGPAALGAALSAMLCGAAPALADDTPEPSASDSTLELTSLSIDQLMNLQVTSVSKKAEPLSQSAAAIAVITQDDIRRSGVTSVPELLRQVPGLEVAQQNSNAWAITSRGFNSTIANRLLVLIDGRSVYTPAFAGVYWDVQDLMLEDIERIEVIRGPAGTLYGANAVNGVINIITKSAKDTQGALLTFGTGNLEPGAVAARYGGKLGEDAYFRIFAKGFHNSSFVDASGAPTHDGWNLYHGGFRLDWTPTDGDTLSALGDYYNGNADQTVAFGSVTPPSTVVANNSQLLNGGFGLLRWQHRLSETSDTTLQLYYDRADREQKTFIGISIDTYDLDFQHRFRWGDSQEIVWGAGFRDVENRVDNMIIAFNPSSGSDRISSFFIQDEVALRDDLRLTAGTKIENNSFTGWEYQPSVALSWQLAPTHTIWASLSRTVRTPSFAELDGIIPVAGQPNPVPGGPPILIEALGDPQKKSEIALSWELGYRGRLSSTFSADVTGFYTRYTQFTSIVPGTPFLVSTPPVHLVFPLLAESLLYGDTFGIEASAIWQASPRWRVTASYTFLGAAGPKLGGALGLFQSVDDGTTPEHQVQLHSYLELPWDLEFDSALYYVGRVETGGVPAYARLDARLGWRPDQTFEFSLSGQNLLRAKHPEFASPGNLNGSSEVPRSIYFKATVRL